MSLHEACNLIYELYGHNSTVTHIINEMINDRGNGVKPSLCITLMYEWKLNIPYNKTCINVFWGVDVS